MFCVFLSGAFLSIPAVGFRRSIHFIKIQGFDCIPILFITKKVSFRLAKSIGETVLSWPDLIVAPALDWFHISPRLQMEPLPTYSLQNLIFLQIRCWC